MEECRKRRKALFGAIVEGLLLIPIFLLVSWILSLPLAPFLIGFVAAFITVVIFFSRVWYRICDEGLVVKNAQSAERTIPWTEVLRVELDPNGFPWVRGGRVGRVANVRLLSGESVKIMAINVPWLPPNRREALRLVDELNRTAGSHRAAQQ
jgi:hypothetical protein